MDWHPTCDCFLPQLKINQCTQVVHVTLPPCPFARGDSEHSLLWQYLVWSSLINSVSDVFDVVKRLHELLITCSRSRRLTRRMNRYVYIEDADPETATRLAYGTLGLAQCQAQLKKFISRDRSPRGTFASVRLGK